MYLPIEKSHDQILNAVADNPVTIVVGQTGSGKTTKLPQFLFEAGFGQRGRIGITEPRRIAAVSVAQFVAASMGETVGKTVAHKIRFDDATDPETVVKFMTDGILLQELHHDPLLSEYAVIMVDEAHERSANIDFLLGLLKQLLEVRPDLRLIVASATIDAEKFSTYFGGAPVIDVDGRLHKVEIVWSNEDVRTSRGRVAAVVSTVDTILNSSLTGDILVFLPGIDEIKLVTDEMEQWRDSRNLVVLPAHGTLSAEEQIEVFKSYPGKRKVVLATNIAETSITIDGIVYVVDTGVIKETHFDTSTGVGSLDVVEHSKAGCAQRAGRAGRTQPGVCVRLFTKENYDRRAEFTEPEIKRMSLAGVVLAMEALEIPDIKDFDFIDPPDAEAFSEAYRTLEALGALNIGKPGLTPMGVEMAALPLDPRISRMVIEAKRHGCVEEVVTIAAFMSVGRSVFMRPKDKELAADRAHQPFKSSKSDMLTFLNVWRAYGESGFGWDWCSERFLSGKTLQEIKNIREQLLRQLKRSRVVITTSNDDSSVLRSVAAGLAYNLLKCDGRHQYSGVERDLYGIFIHPGSSLFGYCDPQWMVTAEIVQTSRRFARSCSVVKPEWLPEIAPAHFHFGERTLKNYTVGDTDAVASRAVLFKGQYRSPESVGEVVERISLDEARDVQSKSIQEAQKAEWVLVTVVARKDSYGIEQKAGLGPNGKSYRLGFLGVPFELGGAYYCKPSDSTILRDYVYPQFRVFRFPA